MNTRKIGSLEEFFQLVGALFGGAKDLTAEVGVQYYEWIKQWFKISVVIFFIGVVFFVLSEIFNQTAFNTIGVFLISIMMLGWLLLAQPLYILGEQLAKFDALKRLFGRITLSIVVLAVLILLSTKAPSGTDGISLIGYFLIMLFGTALAGTQITKKKIGLHFIFWSVFFAAITTFSLTTTSFPNFIRAMDRSVVNNPIFKANELEFSLKNISGEGPLIFLDGEPLWWCREDRNQISGYRCFDQPGNDQTTNEKLFPISKQIIYEATKRLKDEAMHAEQKHAQKVAAEAEFKRKNYIDKYTIAGKNKVEIAIAFTKNNLLDSFLTQQMLATLPNLSGSQIFTPQVVTDGVFDRIFSSDSKELEKLELSNIAERLLIGKVKEVFKNNQEIDGVVDAVVEIDVRLMDTTTGQIINSGNYSSGVFLGHSKIEAQRKAEEEIIAQITKNMLRNR